MGTTRCRGPAIMGVGAIVAVALLLACQRKSPLDGSEPTGAAPPTSPSASPGPYVPRIRGAVSGPPEWLMAESAFDLSKLFEPIPPEQNAAPLYLEALLEFGSELITCYPEDQRQALRDRHHERTREGLRVFDDWSAGRRIDPAELDRVLAGYEPGFAKLAQAQKRPRCVFETGIGISALLPHVQTVRAAASITRLRVARDLERGELHRPVDTLAILLRLCRDLQPRGVAITQMVAAVVEVQAKEAVLDVVRDPGLTPEHADRLLAVLAGHERAAPAHPLADALVMEYVFTRLVVHDIGHRSGDFSPEGLKKLGESLSMPGGTIGQILFGLDNQRGAARTAEQFDAQLALMTAADYRREAQATDEYFRAAVAAARLPYSRQGEKQDELTRLRDRGKILSVFISLPFREQLARAVTRGVAARRGALCLAAVRRWQLDRTTLPPDLATAVRAAGLDAVPIDPFSGEPMRLVILGGEPVVYSVGSDGRDDKARVDWNDGQQPGDFIFRLKRTGK